MVLFITQLTAASTKHEGFSVLATRLTNWWSLNFHISETRLYTLMKFLHIILSKWQYMQLKWYMFTLSYVVYNTHTHPFNGPLSGPGWAGTRKVKPIWILLEQKTVSGSGISWAICKSAPRSRQITTTALHCSSFLQAACPSCRPSNSVKPLNVVYKRMKILASLQLGHSVYPLVNSRCNYVEASFCADNITRDINYKSVLET